MPDGSPSAENSSSYGADASTVRYQGVTKRYPGAESDAVHDLNLEIPAGEICVLVGPSGCGKTTAMRMVNRTVEMTSGDKKYSLVCTHGPNYNFDDIMLESIPAVH